MHPGLIVVGLATSLYDSTRAISPPPSIANSSKATWWKFKTKMKTDSSLACTTMRIFGLVWVTAKRRVNGFGKRQEGWQTSPGGALESQTTKAEVMGVHTVPWFGDTTTSRPGTTGTVIRRSTLFAKEVRTAVRSAHSGRNSLEIGDESGQMLRLPSKCIYN